MAVKGDNSKIALARQVAQRLDEINAQRTVLGKEMSEQYSLLGNAGIDIKSFRVVMSRRGSEREKVEERDQNVELYEQWLYGLPAKGGTKIATRARAREERGDE